MASKSKKIVVVGSSNTDLVIQVPHLPKPGETILGGKFITAPGGKGANQAVGAARAGGKVTFIARVGNDSFGEQALAGFKRDGLDVSQITKDAKSPSGVALIFVSAKGENSIAVADSANNRLNPPHISPAVIASAGIVVTQLETPLATIAATVKIAHARKVPVILNPAPAQKLPDKVLSLVTYLTPNETECAILTGITPDAGGKQANRAAEALLAKGVKTVILTLGDKGAYVASDGMRAMVPAFKVKAVDTTAAGDIFNGALAVALLEGRELLEAVRFASAAAALSVTKLGAQSSAPTRAAIDRLLKAKR
jgi:ribokinase